MKPVARDFLVEIGTEELPPKSLPELSRAFTEGIVAGLAAAGLKHGAVHPYAAPRRLAVMVSRLTARQADQRIKRKGPPVSVAFDAAGAPTRAATAFAASCGVEVAALGRITEPKGEFLHYGGMQPGQDAVALLPGIVQQSLDALPVARRMRWGAGDAEFVRPVHWVVMLYGRDVVPCTLFGLPAGNASRGHRFHAPRAIRITSPRAYAGRLLKGGHVIADFAERREKIRAGVTALAPLMIRVTVEGDTPRHAASERTEVSAAGLRRAAQPNRRSATARARSGLDAPWTRTRPSAKAVRVQADSVQRTIA